MSKAMLALLLLFSIPFAVLADIDPSATADWRDRIEVSDSQSSWNPTVPSMVVTPTFIGEQIYVPVDLSDAWRELDKMLPTGYRRDVASQFGADCSSERISDQFYSLRFLFMVFLSEKWLKQESRLSDFLAVLFDVDRSVMDSDKSQVLALSMILCGYEERESFGEYPKISKLTAKFKKELLKEVKKSRQRRR